MMAATRARLAGPLLLALTLLVGCQSFARLEEDDPRVGEQEVHAAGGADDPELTPHLHRILEHRDEYPTEVVVAALGAVGERRDPASVPRVVALVGDPDEEVRYHVALALRDLGGAEARAALARLAADDPSELVREAAGGGAP